MKKVVWDVLSTARIGREKVIAAMQAANPCDMHAIAWRSLERAQHTVGALGIPVDCGSCEERLADDGSARDGSAIGSETMAACDPYGLQGEAFSQAIRTQTPLAWGVDDAVANMRIIDALFASEKSGAWVSL